MCKLWHPRLAGGMSSRKRNLGSTGEPADTGGHLDTLCNRSRVPQGGHKALAAPGTDFGLWCAINGHAEQNIYVFLYLPPLFIKWC